MKFDELNSVIPYAKGGKEKILRMSPYPNIVLGLPGRHALDTVPVGGDFVVMVTDKAFKRSDHQFTHTDIFKDVELKSTQGIYQDLVQRNAKELTISFMESYLSVITGESPSKVLNTEFDYLSGIRASTFLQAAQCLAVAEHRRYSKYESKLGGRYLPFRFAAGISEGLWTAADAANLQKKGRPGVEILEKQKGLPKVTRKLMYDVGMIN